MKHKKHIRNNNNNKYVTKKLETLTRTQEMNDII